MIYPVQVSELNHLWPAAKPFIQKAIDRTSDTFNINDILGLLKEKKAQLFVVADERVEAAFITTVETSPSDKWVRVMWCGGNTLDWLPDFGAVEQWAKDIGASRVVLYGRPGWKKKLPDYEQTAVILERKL